MLLAGATLAALLLMQVSWGAKPAGAAFPGGDGLIVFASTMSAGVNNPEGDFEIFVYHPIFGIGQLTANTKDDISPSWSADGGQKAFSSSRDGNFEIYKMDADGSDPQRLTNSVAVETSPAWSPGGAKIAFSRSTTQYDVFVMSSDGSNTVRLTKSAANDDGPVWSPNGNKIAFTSNRHRDDTDIFVMKPRPEGRKNRPANLTGNSAAADHSPDWSPTGGQIAFASGRAPGGDLEIYKMNANGSSPTILTTNTEYDAVPAWSPSGAYVVFVRGTNEDLYIMDADGTDQNALTNSTARDLVPDWQPQN